jgi:hypothetical protein
MSQTRTVYVVSFEPDPEFGGVGGFYWFPRKDSAENALKKADGSQPGDTWKLWPYTTSEVIDENVTEEIDSLWSEGWPPPGTEVIAEKKFEHLAEAEEL